MEMNIIGALKERRHFFRPAQGLNVGIVREIRFKLPEGTIREFRSGRIVLSSKLPVGIGETVLLSYVSDGEIVEVRGKTIRTEQEKGGYEIEVELLQ